MAKLNLESSSSVLGNFEVKSPDEIAAEKLEQEKIAAEKAKIEEKKRKAAEEKRRILEWNIKEQQKEITSKIIANLCCVPVVFIFLVLGLQTEDVAVVVSIASVFVICLSICRIVTLFKARREINTSHNLIDKELYSASGIMICISGFGWALFIGALFFMAFNS